MLRLCIPLLYGYVYCDHDVEGLRYLLYLLNVTMSNSNTAEQLELKEKADQCGTNWHTTVQGSI